MLKGVHLRSILVLALVSGCASQQSAPQPAADPGMLIIGGGRFTMGRDKGQINERPAHKVEVGDFGMDRTEVSAADFAEFLNASGNPDNLFFTPDEYATVVAAPAQAGSKEVRFSARPGYERYPANNVSWKGADSYCRWRGKRLPTEAEWEKAARGTDKRLYPWGKDKPTAADAQFEQVWEEKRFDVLVPVDALPKGSSPYGLLNMAGNVLEWTADWYRQNLCDFCNPEGEGNLDLVLNLTREAAENSEPATSGGGKVADGLQNEAKPERQVPPRDNPSGPALGAFKVLRGGSWQDQQEEDLATTRRFWLDPAQRFPNTGFRCSKESARRL